MNRLGGLIVLSLAVAACASPTDDEDKAGTQSGAALSASLNTYIADTVQIDQATPGGVAPEDANLFVGADPADNSASYNGVPVSGNVIDWNDLGDPAKIANHRLLDLDDSRGRDPTSFPRSNECVAASQVLSKMDLRYVASANNNQHAFFGVLRANNNGDAGYYWIFTKKKPKQTAGEAPCNAGETRLVYDVSQGDVLLAGHFKPNGTPLLRVFKAAASQDGVSAVAAVDFTSPLWAEDAESLAAVAVNTTKTAPGLFGAAGVSALTGGNLDPELFAEAAVKLSAFTGSANNCGATYYGSVITRSSGSGGTSPDLKDLAGPALFNFGSTTATATLTPTCGTSVGFEATAKGPDGSPLQNATCSWTFSNGATASTCSGSIELPAGSHTATVTVTDGASSCSDQKTTSAVSVHAPLAVVPSMTGTCANTLNYGAAVSGGAGNATVAWDFAANGGSIGGSTTAAGSITTTLPGVLHTGTVTVSETRDGLTCTASGSATATPYAPLGVSLAPTAPAPVCEAMSSDAVTYAAHVTGGSGNVSFAWNGPGCTGASCTVDPPDNVFCTSVSLSVTANDALCGSATSETETYTKVTTVTATNN